MSKDIDFFSLTEVKQGLTVHSFPVEEGSDTHLFQAANCKERYNLLLVVPGITAIMILTALYLLLGITVMETAF